MLLEYHIHSPNAYAKAGLSCNILGPFLRPFFEDGIRPGKPASRWRGCSGQTSADSRHHCDRRRSLRDFQIRRKSTHRRVEPLERPGPTLDSTYGCETDVLLQTQSLMNEAILPEVH